MGERISLSQARPDLLNEWHPTKNGELAPDLVKAHSGKKAWWICPQGHEYESVIQNRVKGVGCPYCAGKRVLKGYNDLLTLRPEIAVEWNHEKNGELKPDQVTAKSEKRVWWRCSNCGKEWQTSVSNKRQTLCSECSKKRAGLRRRMSAARENSFLHKYPELAAEWHPSLNGEWKPDNVSAGSNKMFWWICKRGHTYKSTIAHRVEGTGCPYCAGKKVLPGFNDLATKSPDALIEWDSEKNYPLTPYSVTQKNGKKVWWKCLHGHSYSMTIAARTSGTGCPYCAGRYVISGETDLESCYPTIAEEWDYERNAPVIPSQIKPHRNRKYWWVCKQEHHYQATPSDRIAGRGCPYCSNRKVLPGFNDLQTCLPELAKEWHPTKNGDLLPTMVTPRGDSVIWWQCAVCGYEWRVSLNRRCGCPKCSDKRQTSFPEQAIYYYVKKRFPDAVNRYRYRGYELDIYIPSIRTAVEYDGVYYHNSNRSKEKDNKKDAYCKEDGIKLYRIRDPRLESTKSATIIPCRDTVRGDHLERAIKKLFVYIGAEGDLDVDVQRDGHIILSMTQKYYRESSLAALYPAVAAEWNYERNTPLIPENVTPGSSHKIWWRCNQGHEWQATVNSRTNGTGCPYCYGKGKVIKKRI